MTESTNHAIHNVSQIPMDANEYMAGLAGELVTPHLTAGWAEQTKERKNGGPTEDTVYAYVDPESGNGFYGVFDGAGGSEDGRGAAEAARQVLHEDAINNGDVVPHNPETELPRLFESMARSIAVKTENGYTTGVVGIVRQETEGKVLKWGAVGDSLGFLIRDGRATQLNKEETVRQEMIDTGIPEEDADRHGNVITNALGTPDELFLGLEQQGRLIVQNGDVILFVSDGVTGDTSKQRLRGGDTLAVIGHWMSDKSMTPRQRADVLLQIATKDDDRAALVIEINEQHENADAATKSDDNEASSETDHLTKRVPVARVRHIIDEMRRKGEI